MMSTMAGVTLCECFARDGLQHEPAFVATAAKRALIERFAALGFRRIEATSYSNPKIVPQFADASELLKDLPRREGVFYKATCANPRAVERALADLDAGFGVNEISLLVSATEAHTQKNLNRTRAEQWANVEEMVKLADGHFRMVGTVSVAFGCPFEGKVDPGVVAEDVAKFVSLGVKHVALGDTTGLATPKSVREMVARMPDGALPIAHFHDTRGTALLHQIGEGYGPWAGEVTHRTNGVLVADRSGTSNAYALFNLQERSELLIGAGVDVYEGMVVGENSRSGDMDVNPTKEKKLTNIRTHAHDEALRLTPPRPLTLESAIEFIAVDELVEVTPSSIRLRKRLLSQHDRRRERGREEDLRR